MQWLRIGVWQMSRNVNNAKATRVLGDVELDLWLYEKRLTGVTYDQLEALVKLPLEQGGRGRSLSVSTIHRRVQARRAERLELLGSHVDEDRLDQLEKIDHVENRYRRMAADTWTDLDGVVHITPYQQIATGLQGVLQCVRDRSKLLGLDAPIRVAQTLTVVDNADLELAAMVAQVQAADERAAGNV